MAKRFRRGSKDTLYRLMHKLIASGWFVVLEPTKRKANGQWSACVLRVLSHEEWAESNPKKCKTEAENEKQPVPILHSACLKNDVLPVSEQGHSIGKTLQSGKNLQSGVSTVKSACPKSETGIRALAEVLANPKTPEAEAMGHHVSAASLGTGTGPVSEQGQVESKCAVPDNPPVSPPVPKRRRSLKALTELAAATNTTVDALLSSGTFELSA